MTNYEKIFQQLGELKGHIGKVETIATQTLEQAKRTNGRVTKLEGQMQGVDVEFAKQKAFGEGESEVKKGISHKRAAFIGVLAFLLGSIVVPLTVAYIGNIK